MADSDITCSFSVHHIV